MSLGGLDEPAQTPSGRLLDELRTTGQPLFSYAMQLARDYDDYFRSLSPGLNVHAAELDEQSSNSVIQQQEIEAADAVDFETYLSRYFG